MYFAELKSSQIATWRSNRTWHQRCLCSCFVSWKQVAAIRGSIMGAGISLVAAMDYVVAPESRSLRWAWAGVWNPIGKLMYSIKHIKLKALNRFEKKAHSRLISSVLTSVQDIQNATSNCREMAWNGDSGYLWMDLMTWYDLVMIWYDLWWLYRFYQILSDLWYDFHGFSSSSVAVSAPLASPWFHHVRWDGAGRTQLSFKEATRGLGACCSWQATVAKLGRLAAQCRHIYSIFTVCTIWLFNSLPWKIIIFNRYKPSISMGHFLWLC